jgi:hypothetical protein
VLDAQEGTGPVPILDLDGALSLLARSRRIAVVGASPDPGRPSHGVMRYLQQHGFDCVPINPNAREVLGVPAWSSSTGIFLTHRPMSELLPVVE